MQLWLTEPDHWSVEGIRTLEGLGSVGYGPDPDVRTQVLAVRLRTRVTKSLLDRLPNVRVVVCPTTGVDHIDTGELERRNIDLIALTGERDVLDTIPSTAEHTFALILASYRHIVRNHMTTTRSGTWSRPVRGSTLAGKTIGIVGYGRVGQMVHDRCEAFGMTVLIHDPFKAVGVLFRVEDLAELAAEVDILTLHVPLNAKTRGMVGTKVIAKMKKGALLVNTSRGALIDEEALHWALCTDRIYAAIDVLADEYSDMQTHPLVNYARTHDNLLITPHIGGNTHESVRTADEFILSKLKGWIIDHATI